MKFKFRYFFIVSFLFFFSCKEEQKDSYFEIKYNLPDYYKEYNYKNYLKENNISTFGVVVYKTDMHLKDSLNTSFLSFRRFNLNNFEAKVDFEKLIEEKKDEADTESRTLSINNSIIKKQGYKFGSIEFTDTVRYDYVSTSYWRLEKYTYRITFSTNEKHKSNIEDFKKMIKNMVYSESNLLSEL